MAAKKTTTKTEFVKNDVVEDTHTDTIEKMEAQEPATISDDGKTIEVEATLANGNVVTLDVIRDQNNWSYKAVEAFEEMNYAVLVNAILTKPSKMKLEMLGATVRDFKAVTAAVETVFRDMRDQK